jgi:hypothetical protein
VEVEEPVSVCVVTVKALRIGTNIETGKILREALGLSTEQGSEYVKSIVELWRLVFPRITLFQMKKANPGIAHASDIHYALFENDEDLFEFKLKYM